MGLPCGAAPAFRGLEKSLGRGGRAWFCACRTRMMVAALTCLWAPILPKEVGVTRDEGAIWRKSHGAEGAQGVSPPGH